MPEPTTVPWTKPFYPNASVSASDAHTLPSYAAPSVPRPWLPLGSVVRAAVAPSAAASSLQLAGDLRPPLAWLAAAARSGFVQEVLGDQATTAQPAAAAGNAMRANLDPDVADDAVAGTVNLPLGNSRSATPRQSCES